MSSILNIAIIGCGKHASDFHMPSFIRLKKKFNVIGVFDKKITRAKAFSKKHNIKKIYKSTNELLKDDMIDIVDVCSPPKFHFKQILESIIKNKDVMVEKPMVLKSLDLKKIIKINLKLKKKILCLQQQSFRDETFQLLNFMKNNKKGLGKLLKISSKANVRTPKQINNSFTDKNISGGGPLIDQGSHIIGLVANILKYPKIKNMNSSIFVRKPQKSKKLTFNIESAAILNVEFEKRKFFEFETSYSLKKSISEFSIKFFFKNGFISWPNLDYELIKGKKIRKIKKIKIKSFASDNQFSHFYKMIKYKNKPITSLKNSLYIVSLIEKCYQFSKTIKMK